MQDLRLKKSANYYVACKHNRLDFSRQGGARQPRTLTNGIKKKRIDRPNVGGCLYLGIGTGVSI